MQPTLSLTPPELATHGNIEQVALNTFLPTSSNAKQRIISTGPSQEHSPGNQASVTQEQPLSTTYHAAPSMLVTPEARVAEKSKGKARGKGTVQDMVVVVVEAVPGTTRKCCQVCMHKT